MRKLVIWQHVTGATEKNNNDAFNYLVQSKFPYFTAKACLNACKCGNLECLKYLLETLKVPIHSDCVRQARYAGYPSDCYHYLIRKGYREPEV